MKLPGRPTKYSDEIVQRAQQYVDGGYELDGSVIPSIEGLASELNIAVSTCHAWRHEQGKEEFSDILDAILAQQARLAINKGLTGEWNSAIVKLLLGKHGYPDKRDNTLSSPDGGPARLIIGD